MQPRLDVIVNEHDLNAQILDAVVSRKYPQNPLLNPDEFVTYLNDRVRHVWKGSLEELDRAGLFSPLFKVDHASTYHHILSWNEDGDANYREDVSLKAEEVNEEDDNIIRVFRSTPSSLQEWQEARDESRISFRSAGSFEPWDNLRSQGIYTATLLYHPFQIFQFLAAAPATNATINLLDHPFTPQEAWKTFEYFQERLDQLKSQIQSNILWKKHLLLLLLIEDKYLPPIREVVSYHGYSFRGGYGWDEWAAAFDAKDALRASGMNIDEVVKFHHSIALDAKVNDPTFSWFGVIRHMPYDQRKAATGKVRLAWDRYEITEMLGDFLADLTGQQQRLPDDVIGWGTWKTRAFNLPVEKIDYKLGNALPGILRNYGLDPRSRVWVFVEGETEEEFIKEWFFGYGIELSLSRVELINLRSFTGLSSPTFQNQAQQARNQGAAIYVLVDEDGNKQERVADLQRWIEKGFIGRCFTGADMDLPNALPIGGFIWEPCFEDHNFTQKELVSTWRRMLEADYGIEDINENVFTDAVNEVQAGGYSTHIKAIEEVAKRHRRKLLRSRQAQFSKAKMGQCLAERYREAEKPINKILRFIVEIGSLRTAVYLPNKQ